uniref:Bm247 n=1 Tax=Brugia malayi TaxID=6279 RepID=A0A0J9XP45_BRUMA|nr:Bm247 [Brugia malayi]
MKEGSQNEINDTIDQLQRIKSNKERNDENEKRLMENVNEKLYYDMKYTKMKEGSQNEINDTIDQLQRIKSVADFVKKESQNNQSIDQLINQSINHQPFIKYIKKELILKWCKIFRLNVKYDILN